MLYHYLDHKRKESSAQLHATYLVSGKFVDNGQTVRSSPDAGVAKLIGLFHFFCGCDPVLISLWSCQSHKVSVVKEDQLEGVQLFVCVQAATSHTISAVRSDSSSNCWPREV